jgi:predicted nucleotidyltransferase
VRTTAAGQSALLLLDVIALLRSEGIDYAVIGAMAASVHGSVRASLDADAITFMTPQAAALLERRFSAAGFGATLRTGDPDDPIPALLALTDSHGNRVDLLVGLRGLDRRALDRTLEVPFQGVSLRVVGREDFIAMKVYAGGPQDLADAAAALARSPTSLDLSLLRGLAGGYGRHALEALEKLLERSR